jgi:hypothetical protein
MDMDKNETIHVLLVYSLEAHELIDQEVFDEQRESDADARTELAVSAYFETEKKYRDRSDLEIVLIGADSLATIETTHGSYFRESVKRDARTVEELLSELLVEREKSEA